MNLGQTIYRLRMERNMSQGDLADALDVSRQSVSKWENNSATPELEKVIHMAQIFDITIDELVTGKAPASPSGSTLPPTKTLIGIALLCCSIVSMVLFLLFALHIWIALITLPLGIISAVCLAPNEKFLRLILICVGVIFFSVVLIFAIILIFHLYRTLIHTA